MKIVSIASPNGLEHLGVMLKLPAEVSKGNLDNAYIMALLPPLSSQHPQPYDHSYSLIELILR